MDPYGVRVFLVFCPPGSKRLTGIAFRRDNQGEKAAGPQVCDGCRAGGGSDQVGLLTTDVDSKRRVGVFLVGFSANHSNADLDFHRSNGGWAGMLFQGVRLHDGPFDLRNIHLNRDPLSPVIELAGLKASCAPLGGTEVDSLSALESLMTMSGAVSYFKGGAGETFLRLRGNQTHPHFSSTKAMNATTFSVELTCL